MLELGEEGGGEGGFVGGEVGVALFCGAAYGAWVVVPGAVVVGADVNVEVAVFAEPFAGMLEGRGGVDVDAPGGGVVEVGYGGGVAKCRSVVGNQLPDGAVEVPDGATRPVKALALEGLCYFASDKVFCLHYCLL